MEHKIKVKNILSYHLDCSLRDGGYYTNWIYSDHLIKNYLIGLKKAKINFVEIGFRFFNKKNYYGPYAYVSEDLLNKIYKIKKNNYGIMVNISDLQSIEYPKIKLLLNKNFTESENSKLKFIRLAVHSSEIDLAIYVSRILKKKGYMIFINLMQISRIELSNLKQLLKKIDNTNEIDVFYVADSLGALDKKESVKIAKLLKNFKKPFGIHAHDNLGKALSNTLTFINHGATWADSTMLGMGRGPGNVDTIKLLKKLRNFSNIKCLKKSISNFVNLKSKYHWGKNIYYALAAKKGIHPSYIQEILNFKDYTKAQVLSTINSLSKINAYSFSDSILESACFQKSSKPINISILKKINLKKKSAIVLGSDNNLLLHSDEINFFIKKKNPLVISLNFNKKKFNDNIDIYIQCHPGRIFSNKKSLNSKKKIISPFQIKKQKKNIIIYPIKLEKNKFNATDRFCTLPSLLSFSYCMAVLKLLNCKKIFLAGFGGYESKSDKIKNYEMNQSIEIIKKNFDSKLISITPTSYSIPTISTYELV